MIHKLSKFRLSDGKAMLASALQNVRNFDRRSRFLMTLVALFAMTAGAWADKKVFFPEGSIVYDFEAAANAGENPSNKNGTAGTGQAFYGWEKSDRTDSKRQDYKGYEWAEGSVLPEVCHVWRRSDRINGNVANNGGLKCPSDKEMAIDGLVAGDKVVIVYDATNATEKNIIWAIGDGTSDGGPGEVRATATINGIEAVTGQSVIPSGAVIQVNKVTPAENGSGYIVFKVFKDMVIKQIVVIPASAGPIVTATANANEWEFEMSAGDVELQVEYYPGMLVKPTNLVGGTLEIEGLTDTTLPEGFEKDAEGNIYVAQGTTFTVKATPEEGYHFVCWSDDENNTNPEREITMPSDGSDLSLSATFAENEYDITFSEGTNPDPENPEWTATPNPAKTKETVTVTYSGSKKVIGVKAEKKSSAPTLKDALADGATVVITYVWFGSNETTFTYTNNGGTYTGNTTGYDAEYFVNYMLMDGTTLKFAAQNIDNPDANVSIDFNTDTNGYVANKGGAFTSFTISVNGTDFTSQLTEVVDETGD